MSLKADTTELAKIAKIAVSAAKEAGAFLMTGHRTRITIEHKASRSDLVTRFDRESEELLKKALAPTGVALVGEETGGTSAERMFFIDPLDGTTNYAHGHPWFSVSIGLVENGEPIFGVVHAPALSITWSGGIGIPAMRNDVPARVSDIASLEDACLATGFPADRRTNPAVANFTEFLHMKERVQAIRRCGSAALDLCLVSDGTYEGYWELVHPWDMAGGAAIVRAAGGTVTTLGGAPLRLDRAHVVATNGKLHTTVIRELAAAGARG